MATSESGLVTEFADQFKVDWPSGYWRKLAGGIYQSGLPDVLCIVPSLPASDLTEVVPARPTLIEFKWLGTAGSDSGEKLLLRGLKRLSALQTSELERIAQVGGITPLLVVGAKYRGETVAASAIYGRPDIGEHCMVKRRGVSWDMKYMLWVKHR